MYILHIKTTRSILFYDTIIIIINIIIIIIIFIIIIGKCLYRANSSVVILYLKLHTIYTLLSWRPCKT